MKQIYTLVAALLCSTAFAQIPAGYYTPAQGLAGLPLRTALHNIIKGHTQISYPGLWGKFSTTDKITISSSPKVWDIYSYNALTPASTAYYYTFSTDQCGSYTVEGDCYNREHSWPQSWFSQLAGPVSDMFHIYPTDGKVNGIRSNYPYGFVSTATTTTTNGSKLGTGTTNAGYGGVVFEPIDEYKGDLARGYFYMTTRYYTEDAGWSSSGATTLCEINAWELSVLMTWHHQDPVSTKEIDRNNAIYGIQNNRNPFIDHPEYADSIWATVPLIVTNVANTQVQVTKSVAYPNPTNNVVTIDNLASNSTLQLYNAQGQVVYTEHTANAINAVINMQAFNAGLYVARITNANGTQLLHVVKE